MSVTGRCAANARGGRRAQRGRGLRWPTTTPAGRWCITAFIRHARNCVAGEAVLEPVTKALETFERHLQRILQRWTSTHNNAGIEGLISRFQSARARARGYRNTKTFITMIYLIAAPLGDIFKST